jgi:hypothetical protein
MNRMPKYNCNQIAYEPLFMLAEEQCDPTHYTQEEIDLFLEKFVYWNKDEEKFMSLEDIWDDSMDEFIEDYFDVIGLDNKFFIKCYKYGFWDSNCREESAADEFIEFIIWLAEDNAARKAKAEPQNIV